MLGQLRHRITFEDYVDTPDGCGGFDRVFSPLVTVWACIQPLDNLGGGERFFAERVEAIITHRVRMRYRGDITTDMRFTFDGRTFQIKRIISPEIRKIWSLLLCVEGVGS